jgi:hypothetical protein
MVRDLEDLYEDVLKARSLAATDATTGSHLGAGRSRH